jgi:hypothetical protein
MEPPFFSLAKAKRLAPILYQAGDTKVQIYAVPEHGRATIWDADVLIWGASQILAAQDRGLPTRRFFRFTPYQLLLAIGRATGSRQYRLLKGALTRLQPTVIRTIRHGEHWRRQQFSWINEWEELTTPSEHCEDMEFVLPEWFYQGALDRLVLAIDPAYFALSGGIERWLYRVARKHAGRQIGSWRFDIRHRHAKSAGLARFSDFALDIRRIVARQPLPGYARALERHDDGCELTVMRPSPFTAPVDKLWISPIDIGTSGVTDIGISGASLSGLQAPRSASNPCMDSRSPALKDSKTDSKSSSVASTIRRGKRHMARYPIGEAGRDRRAPQSEVRRRQHDFGAALAGVCACQSQRASVIHADPQDSGCEWSEHAKEGLPRRCAPIDLARDALNHDAPKIARDLDRATIDGPPQIGVLAPSALLAAQVVVVPTQPRLFEGSAFAETLRLVQGTSILRPQLRVRLALNRCDVRIVAASETARALADDDQGDRIRGGPSWRGSRRTVSPHASTTDVGGAHE